MIKLSLKNRTAFNSPKPVRNKKKKKGQGRRQLKQ